MISAETILARLKQLEVDYALAGMRKPQGTEAFDYGLAAGTVKGIIKSYEEVEKLINEHECADALKESKL